MKSRSVLYDSAKLNNGKEVNVGVDDCVDDCVDGHVDSHVDDSVNVAVEDSVDSDGDGGVDGGESHLTQLTQEVDYCLTERKKQNASDECQDHEVPNVTKSRSVLYDSAKLNDGKEVDETMLLTDVDNSVDGGDNHLTHLTQFESNN
eukprot:6718230-Ditylum_brightwellii.AAC.1